MWNKRINVVIARPRTNVEEVLRRIDIRFRFIEPKVIEVVGLDVSVSNGLPKPLGSFRIRGIDIRADDVFESADVRSSIGGMNKPALLSQHVVVAGAGTEVWPYAEQGSDTHGMELLIHGGWIGPTGGVEIELTLLGHVEKIHDHNIQRKVAVAISLCNRYDLILRRIDCLALDVTVSRFRQQMSDAG